MNNQNTQKYEAPTGGFHLPSLSQLLRWTGVAALTGAFAAFLFQEWQGGNDLMRYLMLLGLTLTLALGGVANGIWLKEEKGARTFLALALGSLPVNFTVIGAFIYLHYGLDSIQTSYPQVAAWHIDSGPTALIVAAVAVPLLAATARFAFSVHTREAAKEFTLLYLLSNAMVALPVRSPEIAGGLVLALTAVLIIALNRLINRKVSLKTFEGRIALAVLFLPPIILVGRSLWLYSAGDFFMLLIAISAHAGVRFLDRYAERNSWAHQLTTLLSVVTATWMAFTLNIINHYGESLVIPTIAISYAVMMYEIGYRRFAALVAAAGMTANLILFDTVAQSLLAMLVGISMMALAIRMRQKWMFVYGGLLLIIGMGRQLAAAVIDFNFDSWGTLAAIGIAAVLAGSLLERHSAKLGEWRREVNSWD